MILPKQNFSNLMITKKLSQNKKAVFGLFKMAFTEFGTFLQQMERNVPILISDVANEVGKSLQY